MDVTIIIPTINADEAMLNRCLAQVRATTDDVEVLVPQGGTFAENCNYGAAQATTDLLVLLNDDTLPRAGWLEPMVAALDHAGVVGSRLLYPDGSIQHAGVYFIVDNGQLHGQHFHNERESGPVDAVTAACMGISRGLFNELGGFDELFRNGNEDVDLCLRARQAGHTIWYCAESTVVHYESRSGPKRWEHVGENVARLNQLWTLNER